MTYDLNLKKIWPRRGVVRPRDDSPSDHERMVSFRQHVEESLGRMESVEISVLVTCIDERLRKLQEEQEQ